MISFDESDTKLSVFCTCLKTGENNCKAIWHDTNTYKVNDKYQDDLPRNRHEVRKYNKLKRIKLCLNLK